MAVNALDETHDPALTSWVDAANDPATDFPPQNLPFGVFRRRFEAPRIGIAIGDSVLDLVASVRAGLLDDLEPATRSALGNGTLNALMALGRTGARQVRTLVSRIVRGDTREGAAARAARSDILVPMSECTLVVGADIGDYTDFYASIHHATNVGALFRPDNPLLPNYKWIPIAYHGRSSSIVASGASVRRPSGQTKADGDAGPRFGPTRALDYEVEVGLLVGGQGALGSPVAIAAAEARMFGWCLVNDWSARDIQSWEYQPLGPFLAKNFMTTVSPWIVTLDAVAPFRAPRAARNAGDPAPLAHLDSANDRDAGAIDITLEVSLRTERMRANNATPVRLSRGSLRDMYWTFAQMIAHHTSNGCNLRPGDLIASGTVSGATPESRGCLLEITKRGAEPIALPNGETRKFLEDGDEITMRGYCEREGFRRIGFGACSGMVVGAADK